MDRSRLEQLEDLCGRLTGQVCDSKADFAWLIVHGYAIELEQILHGLKTESLLKDSQDNDELTVAYMAGREDGRPKGSQGEAVGYVHAEELQRLEHTGVEVIYRDKHQEEFIPVYTAPQPAKVDEYPACSGDAGSCPENEGYGCCKPNPQPSPPDAVQLEKRALELLAEAERGPVNEYGSVHRRIAHQAIVAALSATPEPQRQVQGDMSSLAGSPEWRSRVIGQPPHQDRREVSEPAGGKLKCTWPDCGHDTNQVGYSPGCTGGYCHGNDPMTHAMKKAKADLSLMSQAEQILRKAAPYITSSHPEVYEADALRAIEYALTEAKQQGSGEAVRWEARRKNTITGEWCDWNDCSQKFHDEIVRGETPPGLQARALYTTPPQGEAKRQTAAAVPDGEVRDPHHGGSCSWKWEGGNLFHQSPGSSGWVKCKKIGATPARISAVYQALIAATPAASKGESRNG